MPPKPGVYKIPMKFLATHITRYWYSEPVSMCHTLTHLMPRACPIKPCSN